MSAYKIEKRYNVDSDKDYWLLDSDGEVVALFHDERVFEFTQAVDENATLRAERDEHAKLIEHLKYLEGLDDVNAVMWHIRNYQVKP